MKVEKLAILLAIFSLVQCVIPIQVLSAETYWLNPPTKVSLNDSNIQFKQLFDIIFTALYIYKLDTDTDKRYPKEAVEEAVIKNFGTMIVNPPTNIRFDLKQIDLGKKGWTRYYPFYIGDKCFIIHIFLTEEKAFQPKVPILFEGSINSHGYAVTFQILPGINSILSDCKIKPTNYYPDSQAIACP